MTKILPVAACVFFLACPPAFADDSGPEHDVRTVAVGTIDVIEFDFTPAPNPVVGNKFVLEVQPGANPKQLRLIPLKKGSTSVAISDESGKIRRKLVYNIITNDLSNKALTLRKLLSPVHGIRVETVDDRIVLEGDIKDPKHAERVAKLVKAYEDVVLDLTTTAESACVVCEACAKKKK